MKIKISKDFHSTPIERTIEKFYSSAKKFREGILIPKYNESVMTNQKLEIDFDGSYGYSNCWLDEVFGGLVKYLNKVGCIDNIIIKSKQDPTIKSDILRIIEESERELLKEMY